MHPLAPMAELLTTRQVMDLLQVDRTTVYRMVADGRLVGLKIGQQWRFPRREVEGLLAGERPLPVSGGPRDAHETHLDVLPLDCIQPIQDVFAEIAGVGAVTTDPDGQPRTRISNSCAFCDLILASPSGRAACVASWQRLADQPEDRPAFVTCHAGLRYARARIELGPRGARPTAMLIAGQFHTEPPDPAEEADRIRRLAAEHGLDPDALADAARALHALEDHVRARLGEWLVRVAHTFEGIGRERADLMGRLARIAEVSRLDGPLVEPPSEP